MSRVIFLLAALVAVSARPTVRDVKTKQEFDKILAHHSLTGMPVVVDFYSNSCGPCRMIAPAYQEIAKQNKKDAVFLKVNVQSANVGVEIRSMPTFQFYAKGRKQQEFSGADEAGIRRTTSMLIAKAKKAKKVLEVNSKANFKKVLRDAAKLPVVVGFFSKESEDCKSIYPRFKELAKEYHRKTIFIKVDVDAVAEIKEVAGVDSVPTFHVYEGGKKSQEVTGADEQALHKAVNTVAESNGGGDDEGGGDDGEEGGEKKPTKPKRPKKIARRPKSNLCEKVIILGGGPAGLSAAIYAARAGLHPIVLAPKVGGQLSSTKEVENYPGMIESEGGIILSEMHEQALLYDAGFEEDLAVDIDLTSQPFKVSTNDTTYMARTLIIATGADSRWLGVKGEEEYKTQGVSSCATCDGFLFKNKPVVVVGGGDTAMEDSLVLARTSSAVTLIHRRDTFRASKILQDRVLTNKKITVMWDSEVKEFEGKNDRLATVVVNNLKTNEETRIDVDGAFVAIGHDPNTNLFKNANSKLEMDENGYLETKGKSTYTSIDGVFACGDVADHVYRQAVTSAGTGAMAALDAERWISANGFDKEEEPILNALPEGFEKWRVKAMKEAMKERKLSTKGCVEKPDYIKKLKKWQTKFLKKQAAAGIEINADGTQCKDPPCGTA